MSLINTTSNNGLNQKWYALNLFLLMFCLPLIGQNVGIGTTNPDEELTVVGTIKSDYNSNSNAPHFWKFMSQKMILEELNTPIQQVINILHLLEGPGQIQR